MQGNRQTKPEAYISVRRTPHNKNVDIKKHAKFGIPALQWLTLVYGVTNTQKYVLYIHTSNGSITWLLHLHGRSVTFTPTTQAPTLPGPHGGQFLCMSVSMQAFSAT